MNVRSSLPIALLAFLCGLYSSVLSAQQTGAVVGAKPGSTIGRGLQVVRTPMAKPTCASPDSSSQTDPAAPQISDLQFSREDLICVRHSDGHTEQLASAMPWTQVAANGDEVAYWFTEKHELHLLALTTHSDRVLDTVPNSMLRGFAWSAKGRVLSYLLPGAQPPGLRVVDLDTEQRGVFPGSFVELLRSPDPQYVTAISAQGVVRFRFSDGRQETLAPAEFAAHASYSPSGKLLGVMASILNDAQGPAEDDDTPDCTGGSFALLVQSPSSRELIRTPIPKGFDTVLDFEFSPDDRAIAVTFGVVGCDYPGESARIYKVALSDLSLSAISPADRLSVEPHWSPDGETIVYTDYTGSDSPLMAFHLRSGKVTKLTAPGNFGPDHFLAWFPARSQ